MSLRRVLTIYNAERQLNEDDVALLNTLRKLNDNDRELLVQGLSDKPQKKSSKKAAGGGGKSKRAASLGKKLQGTTVEAVSITPCTYRNDGDADECGLMESSGIHDPTMGYRNYHEFQPAATSTGKSDAQSAAGGS